MAGRFASVNSPVANLTPTQARVHGLVEDRPGLTIIEASRLLGCTHATATYHLNLLLQRGVIECQRDGREVRHFTTGKPRQPVLYLQALCRDPRRNTVAQHVGNLTFPVTLNEMARQLGLPFGFIKRTLMQLQSEGLARVERQRFRYMVMPNPSLRIGLGIVLESSEPTPPTPVLSIGPLTPAV